MAESLQGFSFKNRKIVSITRKKTAEYFKKNFMKNWVLAKKWNVLLKKYAGYSPANS